MNLPRLVIAVYLALLAGCAKSCATPAAPAAPACPVEVLVAPHAVHTPTLDGEGNEHDWLEATPTPAWNAADGGQGRPHSEGRATWNSEALYLLLYAGDEDLEPEDFMGATLTGGNGKPVTFAVSPTGKIDGPYGIQAAVDRDGSLSDAGDDDEEWVVEVAVPWSMLGRADEVGVSFLRSDQPKTAERRLLSWPPPCGSKPGLAKIRLQAPPRAR